MIDGPATLHIALDKVTVLNASACLDAPFPHRRCGVWPKLNKLHRAALANARLAKMISSYNELGHVINPISAFARAFPDSRAV